MKSILVDKISLILSLLISPTQYGFVPWRIADKNLALYTQFITDVLKDGLQVKSIYTDFSKAYDRVSINKLITKLIKGLESQ